MRKKIMAMLLAVVMAVSLLPGTAWAEDAPTSGTCGDNLTWSYSDGVLTIEGTGSMGNDYYYDWPWGAYVDEIHTVRIGDGVTSIGDSAFYIHFSLASIIIPDSVTSIGNGVFGHCPSLTSVTIPDSVTSIGSGAFYFCDSLTSVIIPSGVTSIGNSTFMACTSLTSVTIPSSVTSIGMAAFSDAGLTDVYYGGSESQWKQISVDEGNEQLTSATIHYNSAMPTTPAGPETPSFTDVPADAYYIDAVAWAVENSVTQGYDDGTFGPENPCTRAQIVTFLWRAYGEQKASNTANPFTDVKPGDYYYDAVLWAVENGIASGMTETAFDPSGGCTRAQAVTFQWRAAGKPPVSGGSSFTDVPEGEYYADAAAWAAANGISLGNGDGTFGPENPCTRAQIVTFLYRELGK